MHGKYVWQVIWLYFLSMLSVFSSAVTENHTPAFYFQKGTARMRYNFGIQIFFWICMAREISVRKVQELSKAVTCTGLDVCESYDSVWGLKWSRNEMRFFCTFQISLEFFMNRKGSNSSRNICQKQLLHYGRK